MSCDFVVICFKFMLIAIGSTSWCAHQLNLTCLLLMYFVFIQNYMFKIFSCCHVLHLVSPFPAAAQHPPICIHCLLTVQLCFYQLFLTWCPVRDWVLNRFSHGWLFAVDCSLLGSSVHGILQARIPGWVALPSFRGSSLPRDPIPTSYVSWIDRQILYH